MDQEMDSTAKRQKPTTSSDFGSQPSDAWEIFKLLFLFVDLLDERVPSPKGRPDLGANLYC